MSPLLVIITSSVSTLVKDNLFPRVNPLARQPSSLSMNSGRSSPVLGRKVKEMFCRKSSTLASADFFPLILRKKHTQVILICIRKCSRYQRCSSLVHSQQWKGKIGQSTTMCLVPLLYSPGHLLGRCSKDTLAVLFPLLLSQNNQRKKGKWSQSIQDWEAMIETCTWCKGTRQFCLSSAVFPVDQG